MAFFTASATDGEELASGPDCWSAVFWHPATSRPIQKEDSKMEAKRRFIQYLPRAECSYSLNILSSGMKSISSAEGCVLRSTRSRHSQAAPSKFCSPSGCSACCKVGNSSAAAYVAPQLRRV